MTLKLVKSVYITAYKKYLIYTYDYSKVVLKKIEGIL